MFTQTDELTSLRESDFGRTLGSPLIDRLLAAGEMRNFAKGDVLFSQGGKPEEIFILMGGRVSLTATRSDGESAVIDIISAGEVFPLAAVILKQILPIGAETLTTARCLAISEAAFAHLLNDLPGLKSAVMQHVARQYMDMVVQNKALKLQNTNQRLAHFLLQHTNSDDGAVEVRLMDERRMLARRLGMTPESLSRAIAQLSGCGVEFYQQRVLIRNVDRLRQFCGLERL